MRTLKGVSGGNNHYLDIFADLNNQKKVERLQKGTPVGCQSFKDRRRPWFFVFFGKPLYRGRPVSIFIQNHGFISLERVDTAVRAANDSQGCYLLSRPRHSKLGQAVSSAETGSMIRAL